MQRKQWLKSGTAFALGASLAAGIVFLTTRLGKELQDGGGERLRRQAGERFEQTREVVNRVAQDAGVRLEQVRERLNARLEEGRLTDASYVAAEVSDLVQQAKSIAEEAGNHGQEASARLGASESLGHEARRQEPGAEQAVDLDELIASIIPASQGDNGAVTSASAAEMPAVSTGMKVVAFDGTDVGRVKALREDGFVLSRPRGEDLLAPLDSVYKVEGTLVYLRFEINQLHRQGWESLPSETSGASDESGA